MLEHARAAVAAATAVDAIAREHAEGRRGELRLGFSPGVHYLAQRVLAELDPGVRVSARQDNTGVLAELVARGELEVALGFCPEPRPGVETETVAEEPAFVAVREDHPLARRRSVALADLARDTFALVDAASGAGYNAAVVERCRAAGFEPRTAADPSGPLAWETAVRSARLRRAHHALGRGRHDPRRPPRARAAAGHLPDRPAALRPAGSGAPDPSRLSRTGSAPRLVRLPRHEEG